jgi:membrane-associated protein
MNWDQLLTGGLNLVGAFTPEIAIFIFLVCFIGEAFIVSLPFVFETVWLAAGYQLVQGVLPIPDLILLMLTAQLGRQGGSLLLYFLSRKGTKFFQRFIARRIPRKEPEEGAPLRLLRSIDSITPIGVAIGRLLWLRIPLTLVLGARNKLKTLMLGIVISSLIYEGVYIGVGAIVGKAANPSKYILLYFAAGLAVFNLLIFGVRALIRWMKHRQRRAVGQPQS